MSSLPPTETPVVSVRVMELRDVPVAVRLHRLNLPTGFFVELGDHFLERYYRTFLTSPAAVALIAEVDGSPAGFLVGSLDEVVHHHHMLQLERWRLARAGMMSLLVRPELTVRFVRTRARRYARGIRRSNAGTNTDQEARFRTGVLSHVVVEEHTRRAGVGALLVERFAAIARLHGTRRLRLYTSYDNEPAKRFYERLHWESQENQADMDGKLWTPFTLDLE
ncbi:GNAT family N-acetyltransferase [Nocardiopsis dassonvillei]|uniref:GNAT family N-acetyltransferase n=1 Tax=Nocardiopsis dassonvillei TaxID=2014 RepID=UPI0006880CAB|nr:GNAT family N-acetyltransferase [Nocardiopsis dassonvillei]MCK9872366.1 GNAT family N-acetyltransferase [Nocardiopsis dassonvillei]